MLDIQLKREPFDDVWSVSISHAAEVLQNWNLIGFQVDFITSYSLVMSITEVVCGSTVFTVDFYDPP